MKRVTRVNRWCVLFAAGLSTLGACVDEGPNAPPLRGVEGPRAPIPMDGGAGTAGMAGAGGGGGQGGSQNQGGSGGGSSGAGGSSLPDAGTDASADSGDGG